MQLGQTMAALMTLPDEQREVLVLVALDGLSYKDVAEILGLPIGTVMSRLGRAREALRRVTGHDRDTGDRAPAFASGELSHGRTRHRRRLQAYIDDQLDTAGRIEVERWLQDHPAIAAEVMEGLRLRDEVRLFLAAPTARHRRPPWALPGNWRGSWAGAPSPCGSGAGWQRRS